MSDVNIETTISRPNHITRYTWKGVTYQFLTEQQRAMAALMLDLSNTSGQVAAGLVPPQAGTRDKTLDLKMAVTHADGTPHHATSQRYENFTDDGIAAVMAKVAHHLGPFKSSAKVSKAKRGPP